MSAVALPLWLIRQEFQSDTCLWEAMLHPDCGTLAGTSDSPAALLQRLVRIFEEFSEDEIGGRFMVCDPELQAVEIAVEPARRAVHWNGQLQLKIHAVVWEHPGGNWIAYAPALRHCFVRAKRDDLLSALQSELSRALERRRWLGNLEQLAHLALVANIALESHTITFKRHAPVQRLRRFRDQEDARQSVLRDCVTERPVKEFPRALGRDAEANRLARLLTGRFSRPVLLVGPCGAGKTAPLYEALARAATLPGSFWETNGLRLVAGMSGHCMW